MARRRTQLVYEDVKRAFTDRNKSLLTKRSNPWKWWSTVKTAVFGTNSCLRPLIDRGGKLVWSANKNASLLSAHFDAKQRKDSFQQPDSCDPSPVLCSVAIWLSFAHSLLLDLYSYGGNDL